MSPFFFLGSKGWIRTTPSKEKNASGNRLALLLLLGGYGGALNSPSRRSYPYHTTSLMGNSDYAGEVRVACFL